MAAPAPPKEDRWLARAYGVGFLLLGLEGVALLVIGLWRARAGTIFFGLALALLLVFVVPLFRALAVLLVIAVFGNVLVRKEIREAREARKRSSAR